MLNSSCSSASHPSLSGEIKMMRSSDVHLKTLGHSVRTLVFSIFPPKQKPQSLSLFHSHTYECEWGRAFSSSPESESESESASGGVWWKGPAFWGGWWELRRLRGGGGKPCFLSPCELISSPLGGIVYVIILYLNQNGLSVWYLTYLPLIMS